MEKGISVKSYFSPASKDIVHLVHSVWSMCSAKFHLQSVDVAITVCLLWDSIWTGTGWSDHNDDDKVSSV